MKAFDREPQSEATWLPRPHHAAALVHVICDVLGENQPTARPARLAV
jgi:hypothetical protein